MKIAVTYENGNVFQHFGHSEQFKIMKLLSIDFALHSYNTNMRLVQ